MGFRYEGDAGVRSVVISTKEILQSKFSALSKAIGLYFFLSLAVDITYSYLFLTEIETEDVPSIYSVELISSVIQALLWLVIAIRTHRILISDDQTSVSLVPSINNTESYIRFAVRAIWLLILLSLCFIPFVIAFIASQILIFVVLFIFAVAMFILLASHVSRFFLVLPSIAIRIPMSFAQAISYTDQHRFLMFFTVLLMPVFLAYIPFLLLGYLIESVIIFSVITTIISSVFLVIEVALLSMTYTYIVQDFNHSNKMAV